MKVLHVVGARPNFMKVAPLMAAMADRPDQFEQILVHTGQHYDAKMSDVFFEDLGLRPPDVNLEVGSGTHAVQTAEIMTRFEPVVLAHQPDWVLVPGDVNSTIACALVAAKLNIRIGHVEAGLRSFDRTMPEEINRILTDRISHLLLTPSRDADENLLREGHDKRDIIFVGNIMIDTLVRLRSSSAARWPRLQELIGVDRFGLATLHRPSNVDDPLVLEQIIRAFCDLSAELPIVFPVHPRTRKRIESLATSTAMAGIRLLEPLGYVDFLALQEHADYVVTDSGGIQEETTYLKVPCVTVRNNTERRITLSEGTNRLVSPERMAIVEAVRESTTRKQPVSPPELWDGKTAKRIAAALIARN